MYQKDLYIIRELAKNYKEAAAELENSEKIKLWKALNGLKPLRPMVMIDQVCWEQFENLPEMTLQCTDRAMRGMERQLRRMLFQWHNFRADFVLEPFYKVGKAFRGYDTFLGLDVIVDKKRLRTTDGVDGQYFYDQLKEEADLEKLQKKPVIEALPEESARRVEFANEVLDGIVPVIAYGAEVGCQYWDWICELHGVENSYIDLVDRPELIHAILEIFSNYHHSALDQLEEQGLLGGPMSWIHCTGAFSDELPAAGFDPDRVRAKDIWTMGMAQLFSGVSVAMHDEFEIEIVKSWYERFGLGYYGCCEPLDTKIDIVRKLPNVRKISLSPLADFERGCMAIGTDYVASCKPNPAYLAFDVFDKELVKSDLKEKVQIARRYNTPLEIILKDISTVASDPSRLKQWNDIAMDIVCE